MKNLFLACIISLTFVSCTSVKQIGKVNMISNRNIDPKLDYGVISTYAGGSKKELRKSKATTIEDAIDQTIRRVPGGEFLMNTKIYLIDGQYIAAEGDVWGYETNAGYRGFRVGDMVAWKSKGVFVNGTIKALKDDKTCLIEVEGFEIIEKRYDAISKVD